jgi:uncharacterized protein (DUF362 family)
VLVEENGGEKVATGVELASITISSIDPTAPPVIDPNFHATEIDRAAMQAGVRRVMRLFLDTSEGRDMAETELAPDVFAKLTAQSSDEEIDERVRRVGTTLLILQDWRQWGRLLIPN